MARARSANGQQTAKKTVHWDISGTKRKPGRPRNNWRDTIQQDLKSIGMTWEVAQQLAVNREGWRRRVTQCVFDTAIFRAMVRNIVRNIAAYATINIKQYVAGYRQNEVNKCAMNIRHVGGMQSSYNYVQHPRPLFKANTSVPIVCLYVAYCIDY